MANHRRIVAALRAGDAAGARQAMSRHFTDVKQRIASASAAVASGSTQLPEAPATAGSPR